MNIATGTKWFESEGKLYSKSYLESEPTYWGETTAILLISILNTMQQERDELIYEINE